MALPPLADFAEFEAWYPTSIGNRARAEAILVAASTLIRARTGRVWVDADGEVEADIDEVQRETARSVCLAVTSRVYNNPHGQTQESVTNYSRSVAAWAAQGLSLTEEELAQLGTAPQTGIPGLWSVRVVAPAEATGVRYRPEWWEDDDDNELVESDG